MPGDEDTNASASDVRGQAALAGPAGQLAIEETRLSSSARLQQLPSRHQPRNLGAKSSWQPWLLWRNCQHPKVPRLRPAHLQLLISVHTRKVVSFLARNFFNQKTWPLALLSPSTLCYSLQGVCLLKDESGGDEDMMMLTVLTTCEGGEG